MTLEWAKQAVILLILGGALALLASGIWELFL
jgi:hypothetical protein